jgi:hypothetical protein
VTPCSLVSNQQHSGRRYSYDSVHKISCPEDGSSRFLYNVGNQLPNSAASKPRDDSLSAINQLTFTGDNLISNTSNVHNAV